MFTGMSLKLSIKILIRMTNPFLEVNCYLFKPWVFLISWQGLKAIDVYGAHISSKSSKPLFGAFGQTEKTGFKVFGSFQPGLPRKVPQSLWKVITNGKANLGVHFPSFRHALEAIWGSFSASFAPKRGFQKPFSPYFLLLQIFKTPFRCKRTGKGFWRFVAL